MRDDSDRLQRNASSEFTSLSMSQRRTTSSSRTQVVEDKKLADRGGEERDAWRKSRAQPSRLLSWDELPEWQKDNQFIKTGYRNA